MARKGQIVENPLTGERFRWHLTEADTGGRLVRAEAWVRPGGGVRAEHFHPHSEERFEVLSGRMTLERDGESHVLLGGDRTTVAPGVPHRWCNGGDDELHLFIEVENPRGFEHMIEEAFAAGRDGGMKLRPGAAFARGHAESIRVTSPPLWLQRLIVPPLAWLNDRGGRAQARYATCRRASRRCARGCSRPSCPTGTGRRRPPCSTAPRPPARRCCALARR